MNTWQPIETAPLNQPVLVTDGKSVWFGQVKKDKRNAEDFPFFFGVSLQGDIFCQRPAFYFIEWQPASDIFEKDFPEVAPDLIVAPDLVLNNVKILPSKHGMAFAFDPKEPAEDTKVPTKTADEMFRDLGYRKKRDGKWHTSLNMVIVADTEGNGYFTKTWNGRAVSFSNNEIIACAQAIKEMEHETD